MKLVVVTNRAVYISSWRRNGVDWKVHHPPIMSCSIINVMQQRQVRVMEIRIKISRAMEQHNVQAIVTHIIHISRRQMSHPHPVHQHPVSCSSMKCICAIHWPREWTQNRTACIHLKLFYHKVWKIWVISKLPDRPMCVNWFFSLFRFTFSKKNKKIKIKSFFKIHHANEQKKNLHVHVSRRIGW